MKSTNENGFSIVELLVAVLMMLIVTSAVMSLVRSSMTVASATYELTDAQENVRTAQEYINRDLVNAGDGLKSMNYIPVTTTFVQNYLSRTPIADTSMPSGATNLGILTTDNNVPGNTSVPLPAASPSPTPVFVRANSDRQTILAIDSDPANIQYVPTTIDSNGNVLTFPSTTDMTKFTVGEIYFVSSSRGGTFAAITAINSGTKQLTFANGDPCGLNLTGTSGRIRDISSGGTLAIGIQRMRIIHYFIDSTGILIRREFGIRGMAYRDSIIAEHIVNVQFMYSLGLDLNGNPVQPTSLLTTPAQQVAISQVEVTVTGETAHSMQSGNQQQMAMTTSTSLRNMQFRQALQPQ